MFLRTLLPEKNPLNLKLSIGLDRISLSSLLMKVFLVISNKKQWIFYFFLNMSITLRSSNKNPVICIYSLVFFFFLLFYLYYGNTIEVEVYIRFIFDHSVSGGVACFLQNGSNTKQNWISLLRSFHLFPAIFTPSTMPRLFPWQNFPDFLRSTKSRVFPLD